MISFEKKGSYQYLLPTIVMTDQCESHTEYNYDVN